MRVCSSLVFIFTFSILTLEHSHAQTDQAIHQSGKNVIHAADPITSPTISLIGETCVLLEYESVYDVHTPPDPENYPNMRSQPAHFDKPRILSDLETIIDPADYDFVLLYTVQEVPGWIKNGIKYYVPAENIGRPNSMYGSEGHDTWPELRSVCHMNSLDFLDRVNSAVPDLAHFGSTLTAIHEMGHFWGVYITRNVSTGRADWDEAVHPLGFLASHVPHWMGIWQGEGLPGIMLTAPNGRRFNAWDLYLMGLLNYEQASRHTYSIPHDDAIYEVTLDDVIDALSLAGEDYFRDAGRRQPPLESSAADVRTLICVVKGRDEILSETQTGLLFDFVENLPNDWHIATWELSTMSVSIDLSVEELTDQAQREVNYGFWFDKNNPRWQEFIPQLSILNAVNVYIQRSGNAGNILVEVVNLDNNVLGQKLVDESGVPENGWLRADFEEHIQLLPGSKYRIRVSADKISQASTNRYFWMGSTTSEYDTSCTSSVEHQTPSFDFAFSTRGRPGAVHVHEKEQKTSRVVLHQNYPNPFNPFTFIVYTIPKDCHVRLTVYDILGREVRELVNEYQMQGTFKIKFNAENLANGLYFYQFKAGDAVFVNKMLLVK